MEENGMRRPWLIVPAAVVGALVVLLGGIVAASHLVPVNFLRSFAGAQVSAAFNRPVTGTGDLWIHLGPTVRFVATDVQILNPPNTHFPEEAFVTAARAEASLPFWSLLTGQPRIEHARFEHGSLVFQVRADGVNNWNLSETSDDRTGASLNLPRALEIRDGRIALLDVPANQDSEVLKLDVDFHPAAEGWQLEAAGEVEGVPVTLQGVRGERLPSGAYPLKLDLASAHLTARSDGQVFEGPLPGFDGDLDISTPAYGQLADWLRIPLDPAREDPGALALAVRSTADGSRTTVEKLSLQGSAAKVEAKGEWRLAGAGQQAGLHIQGSGDVALLDLDAYLPPASADADLPTPIVNLAIFQALRRIAELPDTPIPLEWLGQVEGGYHATLDDLTLRDLRIRHSQARLDIAGGVARLRLDQADPDGATPDSATPDDAAPADAAPDDAAPDDAGAADAAPDGQSADPPAPGDGHLELTLRRSDTPDGPVAAAELAGAANALPIGRLLPMPGQGDDVEGYLDADLALSAQGGTWLRLASDLHGKVQAVLAAGPAADAPPVWSIKAEAPDTDQPLTAELALHGENQSQTAMVTVAPVREILFADRFDLKAELAGDLGSGSIDGTVLSSPVPGFEGEVAFQSKDLGALLRYLSGGAAFDGYDPGAVDLQASFAEQDQKVQIRSARLQAGDAVLEATGSIDRQQHLQVDLSVTGTDLDLDRLLPPTAAGSDAEILPRFPIADAFPEESVVAVKADLTRFTGLGLSFSTLALQLEAAPDHLHLKADGAPTGGGQGTVTLSLTRGTGDPDPVLDVDLKLESKDLQGLLDHQEAKGSATLSASLHGAGGTLPALADAVTGSARLDLEGLRHPDLHPVDSLSAELAAEAASTRLKAKATFPVPDIGTDTAIAIVATSQARPPAVSHPAELDLNCQAALWDCVTAQERKLDLNLVSGPSSLAFDGLTRTGGAQAGLDGKLRLKGELLADWDGLVNDAWPHFGPYDLEADLELGPQHLRATNLRLAVVHSDLAGTVQADWKESRPVLDLDLTGQRLDTGDFGSAPARGEDVVARVRLPTGWLDWARGKARLAVAELVLDDGWTVADAKVALTGTGNRLNLDRFEGSFQGGQVGLTGHLEPAGAGTAGAAIAVQGNWRQGDLAALAKALDAGEGVSGRVDLSVRAQSSGTTMHDVITRPSGEMSAKIDQGHIANSVLGLLSVKLSDLFSPLFGSSTETRLNCFEAQASARDGEVQVTGLALDTDLFDLTGSGSLSLPQSSVDMNFSIMGTRISVATLAPAFSVSGPLADPEIGFNPLRTALDVAPSILGSIAGEVVHMVDSVTGGGQDTPSPCPLAQGQGSNGSGTR